MQCAFARCQVLSAPVQSCRGYAFHCVIINTIHVTIINAAHEAGAALQIHSMQRPACESEPATATATGRLQLCHLDMLFNFSYAIL